MRVSVLLVGMVVAAAGSPARAEGRVEFLRDVRPILAGHCFKCHGPDENQRQAGLRLDVRESAVGETDSGQRAIVPGQPDESELVRRIFADDEFEIMPPPDAKHPLAPEQKRTLKAWIAAGAPYQPHWAFAAPARPAVPEVRRNGWPRNPLDRFVLARLDAERLSPAPEAGRHTLVRRVSLDLTGLPPAPEFADEFVHDESPDAYEKLINRLLASPRYGERWARRWLDLARYADTNGYEKDRPRSIWPYRDWVIAALNADKPFDEFTIEQLAGDMLPGATRDQRIATGFHRNTMINEEGGIDPLEFRYYAVVDRINTTATAWLGLTLGCAQCHTHKYDPVPHVEYYRMLAFLNNADEPEIDVPQPDLSARREELLARIAALEADLPRRFPAGAGTAPGEPLDRVFDDWIARERAEAVEWTVLRPAAATSDLPRLEILDDGSVLASGDQTKRDVYEVTFRASRSRLPGGSEGGTGVIARTGPARQAGPTAFRNITAVRLEALPDESLPRGGPGRTDYEGPRGDFFLSEFVVAADGRPVRLARASETYGKLGIGGGAAAAALAIDGDPHTGWSTSGREGERHVAVFNLAEPLSTAGPLSLTMIFERHYAAGLGRFRVSVTSDPRDVGARATPVEIERLLLSPAERLSADDRERLQAYFLSVAPELADARQEIDELRKQLPAYPTTMVFRERPPDHPRPT
ncbi:MAG TPA: DUF1549 domain-containing protein, partial [Planctomycetaceae bacterium]|nr:DUF1549 domain-containing protein [Planctomycetaceae bacterium]